MSSRVCILVLSNLQAWTSECCGQGLSSSTRAV